MKKIIYLLVLLPLITSCSSDSSENENKGSSFSINLIPSSTTVVID